MIMDVSCDVGELDVIKPGYVAKKLEGSKRQAFCSFTPAIRHLHATKKT